VLRSAETTMYIDPFLSYTSERLIPPPFAAEDAPPADIVLCTHEHLDHLDAATLRTMAHNCPHTRFVVPAPIVDQLAKLEIAPECILGVQPGEEVDLGGCRCMPVPALHGLNCPPAVYDFGFEISNGLCRYLGYVIEMSNGTRLYHSGDTLVFDGLVETVRMLHPDVVLLPINGRSYFREQQALVGNIDEREAADLAAAVGADVVIPMHYDMFAANLGRPGAFVDYVRAQHPELACYLPAHGRHFTYTKQ
jgi:L-ascorbate metabolism protein UlaG (beta-lactamase superfamily)